MSDGQLQRWLDSLTQVSSQRWGLIAAAVIVAVGAPGATALATGEPNQTMLVVVAVLAIASVAQPDSYTALLLGVVVVWYWLVAVDDVTTPWVILFASCLFVFHALVALMAAAPEGARIDPRVLVRWARRCGSVVVATAAMWLIVALADSRQAASAEALSAVAFVVLTGLVIAVQGKIVARSR